MGESSGIIRELVNRHLQSVVSLKVQWKDPFQEGRQPIMSSATGSIIHSSNDFMFILTCAHTFKPFVVCHGPGFDSDDIINHNTDVQVDFFDGFAAWGQVSCIDWWKDLCLVFVPFPLNSSYAPVRFIDEEEDMLGQSIYSRGAKVYSIFCFPTNQKDNNLLFDTAIEGEICGRNNLVGNDLDPAFRSDLRFFEFDMAGPVGCSGAPVFNKDFLVMGMRIAKKEDVMFALKFNQIREWAYTWFDIERSRSMNEVVASASYRMSIQQKEIMEIQSFDVGLPSLEYNLEEILEIQPVGVDLSSAEYNLEDFDL